MTTITKIAALIFVTIALFVLPNQFARANAASPPSVAWFLFEYPANLLPSFIGTQLISCPTISCEQSILLQQYGICNNAVCLKSEPLFLSLGNEFACADNRCRSSAYPTHGGINFKLIVQFPDQVRVSDVISALPSNYGEVLVWKVSVQQDTLLVTPDSTTKIDIFPAHSASQNLSIIGFSIIVELIVAGLCFEILFKPGFLDLMKKLLMVLLINFITLPVVWLFFPSLGYFQSDANRIFGIFVLIVATAYTIFLVNVYHHQAKERRQTIISGLVSLPFTGFCFLYAIFFTSYGNPTVIAHGLPAYLIIILAESFAVIAESILITTLSNRTISLHLTVIIAFLMNASSFVLGQIINSKAF